MIWNLDLRLTKLGCFVLVTSLALVCQVGSAVAQSPAEETNEAQQFAPEAKAAFEAGAEAFQAEPPNLEEAAKQFEAAIELQAAQEKPPFVRAYLALGQVYLELEEFEKAAAKLLPVTRLAPNLSIAFVGLGHAYVELKEYNSAVDVLSNAQSLSQQPNPEIHYWRGRAQAELGDLDLAMDDFNDAIALNRSNKLYFGALGKAQMQLGDYQGAIQSLDHAIEMDTADEGPKGKTYAEAYASLGRTYVQLGDLEKAIDNLTQATELAKGAENAEDEREFARDLGSVYQQDKNYEEAIVAFTRLLELMEQSDDEEVAKDPIPYIIRAMSYLELGKSLDDPAKSSDAFRSAIADCDASIELESKIASAYLQRGIAQRMLEKWHDAVDSFSYAIELDPRLSNAYLRRGIVWFYQGEYDIAAADFEDARPL